MKSIGYGYISASSVNLLECYILTRVPNLEQVGNGWDYFRKDTCNSHVVSSCVLFCVSFYSLVFGQYFGKQLFGHSRLASCTIVVDSFDMIILLMNLILLKISHFLLVVKSWILNV